MGLERSLPSGLRVGIGSGLRVTRSLNRRVVVVLGTIVERFGDLVVIGNCFEDLAHLLVHFLSQLKVVFAG